MHSGGFLAAEGCGVFFSRLFRRLHTQKVLLVDFANAAQTAQSFLLVDLLVHIGVFIRTLLLYTHTHIHTWDLGGAEDAWMEGRMEGHEI